MSVDLQHDVTLDQRYGGAAPARVLTTPVVEQQLAHRSVRRYLPDAVDDDVLATLVAAAQSAATSSNLQLWSVVAVRDAERRARLAALAGDQAHVVQAPVLLVWLVDLARAHAVAARHDAPTAGAEYLETAVVGFVDAALAAQNATLAAESLGLGTVYIGALRNHPTEVADLLGLPRHAFPAFGLVVGHPDPSEGARVKPRLPQAAVLHHEAYDEAAHHVVDEYEQRIGAFYADEGLEHSWVERLLARLSGPRSLHGRERLREHLGARGFPLR
ncbi:NADPH-dependent oxidoreductase [Cellulomonas biazotea]|uniref:NADPH-dependent oxidoreductase n=1 Tax=Cellulomonas biazotea TaxID=1709 RepID=A0A402DSQ1_9CELL|nr:NADPH-dependent oxidoreductase [Cellulomonas biazotea]GCE77135.1 NADPH-dependent oxidoreductase [Cellulomonas biazotea]